MALIKDINMSKTEWDLKLRLIRYYDKTFINDRTCVYGFDWYAQLNIGKDEIKILALCEVEKSLPRRGRSLRDFDSMPYPTIDDRENSRNRMLLDELNYDRKETTTGVPAIPNGKAACRQRRVESGMRSEPPRATAGRSHDFAEEGRRRSS
ncbi:helicase-like protein [Striga asiatica]|uniref:Helicase-like protein n=1 Tax=Striga asiatica TaxID=4170 RepID=A0A5A7QRX9_STRAF|nr:helicase-like protein [Striga asiatica]